MPNGCNNHAVDLTVHEQEVDSGFMIQQSLQDVGYCSRIRLVLKLHVEKANSEPAHVVSFSFFSIIDVHPIKGESISQFIN
jgi:hypothetical protein